MDKQHNLRLDTSLFEKSVTLTQQVQMRILGVGTYHCCAYDVIFILRNRPQRAFVTSHKRAMQQNFPLEFSHLTSRKSPDNVCRTSQATPPEESGLSLLWNNRLKKGNVMGRMKVLSSFPDIAFVSNQAHWLNSDGNSSLSHGWSIHLFLQTRFLTKLLLTVS